MSDSKRRAPIKDVLDVSLDEARVQRMWRGIQREPKRSSRRWFVAAAFAAAVVALGVVRVRDAGPLSARGASALAFDRPSTVLSDGSRIALADGAQLQLVENTGESFVLKLERGKAHFEVTPGGPRRWRMECGLASVTVVGTELTIERGAGMLRVEVAHGIVEVRSDRIPGGMQRVTAGQSLSLGAPAEAPAAAGNQPPSEDLHAAVSDQPPSDVPHAATSGTGSGQPARPHAAASGQPLGSESLGDRDARASASASGMPRWGASAASAAANGRMLRAGGDPGPERPSRPHAESAASPQARLDAAGLLVEADRARQSGSATQARVILQQLLRSQPSTAEAGIAGLTLARMQMETDPRAASEALRGSLSAATPESLREDALARLVEAYARSGEHAHARSTADEYRHSYPNGRRLAEVERWAAQP